MPAFRNIFVFALTTYAAAAGAANDGGRSIDSCLSRAEAAYAKIGGYTCLFDKTELAGGKYRVQKNIFVKFRKPFSVYMKWTEGRAKGYEILFSKEKYRDRLIVHPNGILRLICLSLDPNGTTAMKNNRHSIKDAGIGFVIETMQKNHLKSTGDPLCSYTVFPDSVITGRKVIHLRGEFPDNRGYYCGNSDIYFDYETSLPLKIINYGWHGELWEDYCFHEVRINPGLTDADFERSNKEYGFNGPLFNH